MGSSENCCSPMASAPPSGLAERAQLFKALGDEIRLNVLHLVREQEVCVCDLIEILKMPQGTLSHHLAVLQKAGLVTARKQGRWNYYRAAPLALEPFRAFAD